MTYLQQLNKWSSRHHPKWFVVLRVLLGLCLFVKGIQFIQNSTLLEQLISKSPYPQGMKWLKTFIPWAHLIGGTMLVAGLFTRLSALLQIPILIVAVFFINLPQGGLSPVSDFFFSLLILLLLLFFLLKGGGPFSLDNFFERTRDKKTDVN